MMRVPVRSMIVVMMIIMVSMIAEIVRAVISGMIVLMMVIMLMIVRSGGGFGSKRCGPCHEARAASARAEIIGLPLIGRDELSAFLRHGHTADGIDGGGTLYSRKLAGAVAAVCVLLGMGGPVALVLARHLVFLWQVSYLIDGPSHHGKVNRKVQGRIGMQIGEAASATGVSAKMIRHYESIGLIPAADRRDSNYRDYSHHDVHRLGFIRRARDLGFSIDEIRELLRLWADRRRSSADVKALTMEHISGLEQKIALLEEMRSTLSALAESCDGDHRAHCPIIVSLEGTAPVAQRSPMRQLS